MLFFFLTVVLRNIFQYWNYTGYFFQNWYYINASMWSFTGHPSWDTKDKGEWVNADDAERWNKMERLSPPRNTCSKPELGYQTKGIRRHEQDSAAGISSLVQESPPRRSCIAVVLQHYFLQNECKFSKYSRYLCFNYWQSNSNWIVHKFIPPKSTRRGEWFI